MLTGAIDYAGLFPPASLNMSEAVSEYARHRGAPDRWALGRFVVALSRWDELVMSARALQPRDLPWPVSLLAAPSEAAKIREIMLADSALVIESVECKASSVAEAALAGELVAAGIRMFVEPATLSQFASLAPELARSGAAAKIRTGGITADAFPAADEVLAFLRTCRSAGIRFKATAGLHHAVRGEYRLTYEPSPPTGEMFGFLNVAIAAALLWFGHDDATVLAALEERSADAFEFTDDGLRWRERRLSLSELDVVRQEFFAGFGSCSFREPLAELGLAAVPHA